MICLYFALPDAPVVVPPALPPPLPQPAVKAKAATIKIVPHTLRKDLFILNSHRFSR
jgi:hypothetical protein